MNKKNKRNPWKHFVRKYLNKNEFETHLDTIKEMMLEKSKKSYTTIFKTFQFTIQLINGKEMFVHNQYYNLGGIHK